ncbi:MAG: zinc-ribbon domain-containing protein [Candidatus Marinimicrobia bacterium]|jgi:hypothetical protein|nr:zinc-ribbon domain-containing protein [Candidatus Neomarinimicrobiota bacterium]MBT4360160.1 zinc-ribbon domain-containing protein [Candidatus Neomarinimicrobiota bacterium]MBT4714095.1 zinc-ribbon domain-containing protein [Candidatus Neomarinimicrobiota bacterium]MBT4944789.1 zinc-ribbon domain-containing protein [Candidatus Neomarinimicrobiota bacterium]MBT5270443.1 zinc-ribbon domain-containing protein [Candidatus Neomarinimicrobiota bacterium]
MAVLPSFTKSHPDLALEIHPSKNPDFNPASYSEGSHKKIWWECPFGDDHEWEAPIYSRVKGTGCPVCSGRKVVPSNCLATTHPDLVQEWCWPKNISTTPHEVTAGSHKKVWWKCDKGSDHIWETSVYHRTSGEGCPVCSNNMLVESNSLGAVYPNLASEWHTTKNGKLTPADVQPYSNKSVWWKCKINPKHEWKATVNNRQKAGCPYCGGLGGSKQEMRIYSELLTIFPDTKYHAKVYGKELDVFVPSYSLGIEYDGRHWHKTRQSQDEAKNNFLKSKGVDVIRIREKGLNLTSNNDIEIIPKSEELDMMLLLAAKIQSILPSDALEQDSISDYLAEKKLRNKKYTQFLVDWFPKPIPGESLKEKYPDVASQWHPTRNDFLKPSDVFPHAGFKVWWQCEKGHEWETTIDHRTGKSNTSCPECYKLKPRTVKIPFDNLLSTKHPNLVSEWHPIKNGELKPNMVGYGSHRKVWWICNDGHEWLARIDSRSRGNGCPYCSNPKMIRKICN